MHNNLSVTRFVGQSIKTFRVEALLEQREMGAIYLARSTTSQQTYRLHLLLLPPGISPAERMVLLGYFQHQAGELNHLLTQDDGRLRHPHLLPLLDSGSYEDVLYLVTPSLCTRSLTTLLDTQGPLDAHMAGMYLDQVASALEYAHQHALLHGDLTGDAVLLRRDGSGVVADLGVRQMLDKIWPDQSPAAFYTQRSRIAPAPEQLRGQVAHTSTDVYALGALLYQLLTGSPLFQGESATSVLDQHLRAPVPSLATRRRVLVGRTDVTSDLDRLLAAALTKDPQQRIQHPARLANAYHQIVVPARGTRVAVHSPLAEALAVPLAEPGEGAEGTRAEQYARKGDARAVDARRRALLALGGGAVTVGALAYVVNQLMHGSANTASPLTGSSTTIGSTGGGQATTGTSSSSTGTTGGGQATASSGSSGAATPAGNVIAQSSAVPLNSSITFNNPNPNSSQPGVLVHLSNGKFVAFDSSCTHYASCAVQYVSQDKLLECPCHGAQFDPTNQASVVQGPAGSPLAPIAITVHPDGSITAG